jgi:hypothetical protein
MRSGTQQRARRLAALLLLAVSIAAIWVCLAQPVLGFIDTATEERGISLRALKRNRALLREAAAINAAQATIEQSPRWRNFYVAAKPEAATLDLETDLRSIFRDSNNPTSMIAEAPGAHGSVTRLAVRITLSMRVDQLADALDRIQKQSRQLRIESLTIQAPEFQGGQVNPLLSVQAEITAMMVAPVAAGT